MGCTMCPRACGADREGGNVGFCGVGDEILLSRAALHLWEEPCISVGAGSGTVFFAGCPLKCVFCQNREISRGQAGIPVTEDRLFEIFFELKAQGAANINLVTPTHYADRIAPVIEKAKDAELDLPFVYNCGGYESVETLRRLSGLIDVYMPDLKFLNEALAQTYSHAADYPKIAKAAIDEMVRQRPYPIFEGDRLIRGVLVRHLVLPGCVEDSKQILSYLHETYGDDILVSIMSQYTPPAGVPLPDHLHRPVSKAEYDEVLAFADSIHMHNIYTQSGDSVGESFIPPFDHTGV